MVSISPAVIKSLVDEAKKAFPKKSRTTLEQECYEMIGLQARQMRNELLPPENIRLHALEQQFHPKPKK